MEKIFKHRVKYNGVIYPAGMPVPLKGFSETEDSAGPSKAEQKKSDQKKPVQKKTVPDNGVPEGVNIVRE